MSRTLWQRIRWAAIAVIAAGVSGLSALSRPASSALPPPVSLRGDALEPSATNSGLVVVPPPVVILVPAEGGPGVDSLDSPFDEGDGDLSGEVGSTDSVDDGESDVGSAESPDGGD